MEHKLIKNSINEEDEVSITQVSIFVKNVEPADDLETKLNNWLRGMNVDLSVYSNIDSIGPITSDRRI